MSVQRSPCRLGINTYWVTIPPQQQEQELAKNKQELAKNKGGAGPHTELVWPVGAYESGVLCSLRKTCNLDEKPGRLGIKSDQPEEVDEQRANNTALALDQTYQDVFSHQPVAIDPKKIETTILK